MIIKCPYCAEDIRNDTIMCKHCSNDLTVDKAQAAINHQTQQIMQEQAERERKEHLASLSPDQRAELRHKQKRKDSIMLLWSTAGVLSAVLAFVSPLISLIMILFAVWMHPSQSERRPTLGNKIETWREHPKRIFFSCVATAACISLFFVLHAVGPIDLTPKDSPSSTSQTIKTPTKADKIKKQFNAWNGSHIALVRYVKSQMNNPSSYEHVSTKYAELDNGNLQIVMTYRGENAFWALIKQTVTAEYTLSGKQVSIFGWV